MVTLRATPLAELEFSAVLPLQAQARSPRLPKGRQTPLGADIERL